jgi:hypothetical protein
VPGVVVTLAVVTLTVAFRAVFMVNDDAAMSSFASGMYTGQPARHLVFMGAMPGFLFAALYRAAAGVPWYGATLVAAQTACIAALATLTWARRRSLGTFVCVLVSIVIAAYLPVFTLTPTFTVTAMLVTFTAVVAFAASLDSPTPSRWLVAAALCLVAGSTLRWDAAIGALVTLFPLLVALSWRLRTSWRRWLAALAVAGVLMGSVHGVDVSWSQRRGWAAFAGYNAVRGKLHGTTLLTNAMKSVDDPKMTALLHELAWTTDDLTLFAFWFFDDPRVYSKAHLERLLDVTGRSSYSAPLRGSLHAVSDGRAGLVGLGLLSSVAAIAATDRRRRRASWIAVQLGWALAVDTYVASRLRLPDRVAVPSIFGVTIAVLLGFQLALHDPTVVRDANGPSPRRERPTAWVRRALIFTAIAVVLGPVFATRGPVVLSRKNRAQQRLLEDQLAVLDQVDRHGRFVAFGAALDLAAVDPFEARSGQRSARVLEMGWPTFSPLFVQREHRLGINGDLLAALIRQNGLYLVAPPSAMPLLQHVYLRRNAVHMTAHLKASFSNGESVFQLRESTKAEPAAAGTVLPKLSHDVG